MSKVPSLIDKLKSSKRAKKTAAMIALFSLLVASAQFFDIKITSEDMEQLIQFLEVLNTQY